MNTFLIPNHLRRLRTWFAMLAVMTAAFLSVAAGQAFAGAVVTNGTVALGVNDLAQLNFADGTRFVGVTYEPTGNDGTRAGCPCEGWGAAVVDPGGDFSGFVDNAVTGPGGVNLDPVSFSSTASTATSVASIDGKLKVTHDFAPSASTPNLYEIKVTLENIGTASLPDVRYTRLMDWDIEPTAFSEFVTIQRGSTPAPAGDLIYSNDNGFETPDPLAPHAPIDPASENADYTDKGPDDHGALFDFAFGALGVGEKKEFSIFYGAAGTEPTADAAVSAAALELYSYGQPNGGEITGEPNTFIWGFKAVGGTPVIPPTLTLSPKTATNPVNTPHTVTAELKDSLGNPVPGAAIVFEVSGANTASGSDTTDSSGQATFTYTGTNAGGDTIKACLDNNGSGTCDPDEVTDTAAKTWSPVTTTPCVVKITNGGWIVTDDGDRGSFGGVAKETIAGVVSGQEQYTDHGPAEPMNVHSLSIVDIICDGTTKATIFGVATIDGTGSHPFQIDVQDIGEPGKGTDHYRIRIPDIGYDSGDHILRGGNVQIH